MVKLVWAELFTMQDFWFGEKQASKRHVPGGLALQDQVSDNISWCLLCSKSLKYVLFTMHPDSETTHSPLPKVLDYRKRGRVMMYAHYIVLGDILTFTLD